MTNSLYSSQRRDSLLQPMNRLKQSNINCFECRGVCCTFVANSMQITPLEALELFLFLKQQKRWSAPLLKSLSSTIKNYRLDVEIQTHRSSQMRKTYTCPFYTEGGKGCSIFPEFKPYGCLGFNPLYSGCVGEGGCESDISKLSVRDNIWSNKEAMANQLIKDFCKFSWDKLDIPRALIEVELVVQNFNNEFFVSVARKLEK